MKVIDHLLKKVKFIMELQFPIINQLFPRKGFIGGRIGYSKELIFKWLLIRKVTNWDYRSLSEMAGVSYQTLNRRNKQFQERKVYQTFFLHPVKKAVALRFIKGEKVAIDSSFVKTYSNKEEMGSCGFNGHKKSFSQLP